MKEMLLFGSRGAARLVLANARIPWDQANAMAFTVFALCEMGRWEEAAPLLQETQALAERLGNFGARLTCLRNRGWAGLARGDGPAEFERFAREDLELCRSTGWPWIMHAHLWLGAADFWQGRWDEAIDQLEDAVRTELPGVFAGQAWGALFLARARMGDRASAEAMLLDRPDVLEPPGPPPRSIGTWERLSATAEGLVLLGRAEEASAFYPALLEQLDHGTVLRGFDGRLVRAVAAMVAGAAGNWNEADSHYRATLELADRRPHPIEQAEVRRTWAEALLRREGPGDRSRAFELLGDAAQRYQELGMPRHREMTEAALVNFPPHLSGQPERRRHGSG